MDLSAFGNFSLGDFTIIDLIAATTNAFNGAILARQPSHYRKYTVVGIVLIAIFGGIGGGVSRDVLLNDIPSALTNPLYLILCALAGFLALRITGRLDKARTTRLFDFMRARAERLGGTLVIEPGSERGTRIIVDIPRTEPPED